MGKEITIIGVDPGLTKTGIGVLTIKIDNTIGVELQQFILSHYLLLLNLQSIAIDAISSIDNNLPENILFNFISKKKIKTKKEKEMDNLILR